MREDLQVEEHLHPCVEAFVSDVQPILVELLFSDAVHPITAFPAHCGVVELIGELLGILHPCREAQPLPLLAIA